MSDRSGCGAVRICVVPDQSFAWIVRRIDTVGRCARIDEPGSIICHGNLNNKKVDASVMPPRQNTSARLDSQMGLHFVFSF